MSRGWAADHTGGAFRLFGLDSDEREFWDRGLAWIAGR